MVRSNYLTEESYNYQDEYRSTGHKTAYIFKTNIVEEQLNFDVYQYIIMNTLDIS